MPRIGKNIYVEGLNSRLMVQGARIHTKNIIYINGGDKSEKEPRQFPVSLLKKISSRKSIIQPLLALEIFTSFKRGLSIVKLTTLGFIIGCFPFSLSMNCYSKIWIAKVALLLSTNILVFLSPFFLYEPSYWLQTIGFSDESQTRQLYYFWL